MDTSEETQEKNFDIQTNVISYLLNPNYKKITLEELSAEKCLEIFEKLAEQIRPQLNYLSSEFMEIKEMLSREFALPDSSQDNLLTYQKDLNNKTRIMEIIDSYGEVQSLIEERSKGCVTSFPIYLTSKCQLIVLTKHYNFPPLKKGEHSIPGNLVGMNFEIISKDRLLRFFKRDKGFIKDIVFTFISTLSRVIKDRNSKTKNLEESLVMFDRVNKIIVRE